MDFHLILYCRHILLWAIVVMSRLTVKTLKNVGRCMKQGKEGIVMPPSSTRKILSLTVLIQAQSALDPHRHLSQDCIIALGEYHPGMFSYSCVYQHEFEAQATEETKDAKATKETWLWRLMPNKTDRGTFCLVEERRREN